MVLDHESQACLRCSLFSERINIYQVGPITYALSLPQDLCGDNPRLNSIDQRVSCVLPSDESNRFHDKQIRVLSTYSASDRTTTRVAQSDT